MTVISSGRAAGPGAEQRLNHHEEASENAALENLRKAGKTHYISQIGIFDSHNPTWRLFGNCPGSSSVSTNANAVSERIWELAGEVGPAESA